MPARHVATQPSSPTPRAPSPSTHTVPRVTQGAPASSCSFELGNTHRLRWHGSAITIVSQAIGVSQRHLAIVSPAPLCHQAGYPMSAGHLYRPSGIQIVAKLYPFLPKITAIQLRT
ncbi:uncharacterized protein LOC124654132 [Lolium rigidum]|uniref:uncharacterized protein LOC124654132 n=1 Tax=Lolium rigidum TaxID=89674 RepID=UPI001F5D595C|nr:uncharacterized protein LOC124654132 [Lolium rigidum]